MCFVIDRTWTTEVNSSVYYAPPCIGGRGRKMGAGKEGKGRGEEEGEERKCKETSVK